MNYSHLTNEELHRIARDSTDPLVLELMRRMDEATDELEAAAADEE